ncbi:MAG: hypothetical protein PVF51_03290 [Nitrospirota bacterium]|jgi:hypothetical protein
MRTFLTILILALLTVVPPATAAGLPMEIELQAADLDPVKQETLARFLEEHNCPCGCGKGTLKNCIEKDRVCGVSRGFARQAIAELRIGDQIVATRKAVADYQRPKPAARVAEDPNKTYEVEVGDAPVIGPSNAQVTAIAFLDYQ